MKRTDGYDLLAWGIVILFVASFFAPTGAIPRPRPVPGQGGGVSGTWLS